MQSLQDGRFTLTGTAKPLPEADKTAAREAYLGKYPQAFYVDFGDFRWFRMEELNGGRFVGGFGRVASVSMESGIAQQLISTSTAACTTGSNWRSPGSLLSVIRVYGHFDITDS
jgi:hypothetical protein